MNSIPFHKPYMTGKELWYISQALNTGKLASNGNYTKKCCQLLEQATGSFKALVTHSCTAALEMAAILVDLEQGDEVIIPSYTFVSSANAFVMQGAIPVFVDIRSDTLNLDETLVEAAITERTRAIVPVHYGGVSCEMDALKKIARKHNLLLIEDAAQGFMSRYKGRPLGSIGDLGCFSFHETKNIVCGKGGTLLINAEKFADRAQIIGEKGTNRSQFFRGQSDKYTWVDKGSSYLLGEIIAAFLYAQLEEAEKITGARIEIWQHYHQSLEYLEQSGKLRRPIIPSYCEHNAHMYYILLENSSTQNNLINYFKEEGINIAYPYVPLHSSPAGLRYGRTHGELKQTNDISDRLLRLPLFPALTLDQVEFIVGTINKFFTA